MDDRQPLDFYFGDRGDGPSQTSQADRVVGEAHEVTLRPRFGGVRQRQTVVRSGRRHDVRLRDDLKRGQGQTGSDGDHIVGAHGDGYGRGRARLDPDSRFERDLAGSRCLKLLLLGTRGIKTQRLDRRGRHDRRSRTPRQGPKNRIARREGPDDD